MGFWIILRLRQKGPHHEVSDQVVPRFGRKQHGVTRAGEPHQLDVKAFRRKALGEREGMARIRDAIRSAVGEKQPLVIQRRNRLAGGEPWGERRDAAHSAGVSSDVVGHPQRDPSTHGVPDESYGQVAETLGQLIESPPCVWQRRLQLTVPSAYRIPKCRHDNSSISGASHTATKRKHAENGRIEGSNRFEAVRGAAMQKEDDGLGTRAITRDAEVGSTGHAVRLLGVPVNWLNPIHTSVRWKFWKDRLAVGPR